MLFGEFERHCRRDKNEVPQREAKRTYPKQLIDLQRGPHVASNCLGNDCGRLPQVVIQEGACSADATRVFALPEICDRDARR